MEWSNYAGTLITWTAIVIIVLVRGYFRHQTRVARYRLYETMAEKGQTVPPDTLAQMERHDCRDRTSVGSGITLMCVGVGLGIFFWALSGGYGVFHHPSNVPDWLMFVGVIPFMIGLGRVLSAVFDKPRQS
jgi:hypothetical protein